MTILLAALGIIAVLGVSLVGLLSRPDTRSSALLPATERYTLLGGGGESAYRVLDRMEQRTALVSGILHSSSFAGWTVDQHYGIFVSRNQYGASETVIFDTRNWEIMPFQIGTACATSPFLSSYCPGGALAVSPTADQYVSGSSLVDIPSATVSGLVPEGATLFRADWAPDGSALAFAAGSYNHSTGGFQDSALYLANGDGNAVRRIVDLPRGGGDYTFEWSGSALTLTVKVYGSPPYRYVIDRVTGAVEEPGT